MAVFHQGHVLRCRRSPWLIGSALDMEGRVWELSRWRRASLHAGIALCILRQVAAPASVSFLCEDALCALEEEEGKGTG